MAFDFTGGADRFLVLDVETQYMSHEVPGGWNAVEKFRVALAVTWDSGHGSRVWYEDDVARLLAEAANFDPIVTFNGEGFDFKVLSAYGDVSHLYAKSADLLAAIGRRAGFRVKLDSLAQATLGRSKTGSGAESVEWWRSGDPVLRQKVVDYCTRDVELTRDLYLFAKEKGYLLIEDLKLGQTRKIETSF